MYAQSYSYRLHPPSTSKEEADFRLLEAESLIKTYGGVVLVKKIQKKTIPDYRMYIGGGKLTEIMEESKNLDANILIVNNELKPNQVYHLQTALDDERKKKPQPGTTSAGFHPIPLEQVWDRLDLILKIFQKHAQTREAKLEIELASIRHMGPRIFGMGMELSRQGGGIGTRGGGETNIEMMKRHLFKREKRIEEELKECQGVRELHRAGRRRKELKTVGIIGYTNAGKTSLLNSLTRKGAVAANQLFTTLDTRVGKMYFPHVDGRYREILISDTIGFIQDLPPTLIKSFQSTLEETIEADLLVHVIDVNDPKMVQKMKVVNEILAQIDALHKPTIYVFNKIDLLSEENLDEKKKHIAAFMELLQKHFQPVATCFISTANAEGVDELKKLIQGNV